jgi:hypothetical protein
LAILQYALTVLVFGGFARYRSPIEPFCLILAVAAVVFVWQSVRELIQGRQAILQPVLSTARND